MKQRKQRNLSNFPPLEFPCRLRFHTSILSEVITLDWSVKGETILTLGATLKAHKYSNVRQQQRQQHLCVYKTERSPVGVSLLHWNMKRDRQ